MDTRLFLYKYLFIACNSFPSTRYKSPDLVLIVVCTGIIVSVIKAVLPSIIPASNATASKPSLPTLRMNKYASSTDFFESIKDVTLSRLIAIFGRLFAEEQGGCPQVGHISSC